MVFREASATFAFILGPLLGGFLISNLGITGPFGLTCIFHMSGMLLLKCCVEEAEKHSVVGEGEQKDLDLEEEPQCRFLTV